MGAGDSQLKDPHDNILTDVRFKPVLPAGKTLTADAMGNYVIDLTDVPPIPNENFAPPLTDEAYGVDFFYTYTPDVKTYWQGQMSLLDKGAERLYGTHPGFAECGERDCLSFRLAARQGEEALRRGAED